MSAEPARRSAQDTPVARHSVLWLFVAGARPNSLQARENLAQTLRGAPAGRLRDPALWTSWRISPPRGTTESS